MTHMRIKLGNSFSLSFQNMVLRSLCTTWLCSDYWLLQFLAISVYALSSHPSPPAFWPHLPVTAQNSTTLQDTVVHHHIKHLSSHTSSLSLELPNRTHEIWTNYENITKMQERPRRMQEHCVTLSVRGPAFSVCPQRPATLRSAVQISQVWIWALIYLS